MPLIVTPGSLSRQSELYHQLGQMLSAGVPLLQTLEHLYRAPPARSFRQPIRAVLTDISQGFTLSEALVRRGRWLPSFDLALLEAGERSGRLDACFQLLANYYAERANMARRMISDMAYPAFLVHAAIFIIPTLYFLFLGGSVVNYLLQTFGALLPIYAVVFLLLFACQGKHGESWRAIIERTLHPIPVLGNARRNLALARLAAALEALLSAGVPILDAWELAAAASGSPALRRVVSSWHPRLMSGATPGELLRNSPDFPELFANFYNTGEVSGTIDENLRRLHKYYLEEGSRKLRAVVEWTPRLVYLVVALLMAWQIISMWIGYVSQIRDVLGF